MQWGVKIPMRDGVHLSAILYRPAKASGPVPAICTRTPYIAQNYHEQGMYFAKHGFVFLVVDVRGRGNSDGTFHPLNEAPDGHDTVEWLARQPYCNGQVAMWGLSYLGYSQWAAASQCPKHLATIVPAASACFGVDIPIRNNVFSRYMIRWLTAVSGRTLQDRIFADQAYWHAKFRETFETGLPLNQLDREVGNPSPLFQEWLEHPHPDEYWDRYNPTPAQYAKLAIPILTITGSYDDDQPGALAHYRTYMQSASPEQRAKHFLIIGPWDHPGTQKPKAEFGGFKVGPASLVDLSQLHLQWYAYTMQGGPRPEFLQKNVAYYVTGSEDWRYADTLDAITARHRPLYLQSTCNPTDVYSSGTLGEMPQENGEPDRYTYDPRDNEFAELESTLEPDRLVNSPLVNATRHQLIYHSDVFAESVDVCGFFRLSLWLGIDQPDADFRATVYEVDVAGRVLQLSSDWLRARYRSSSREPHLIETEEPLRYDFERFTFTARRIAAGSRLRLVVGALASIHWEKNHHSGGRTAQESFSDARSVNVRLFHSAERPSVLHVPIGS